MTKPDPIPRRVVLVTGPSGAGRSSAIKVLEDIGFEAIDNMPLRLIPALLEEQSAGKPMALGIDPRTRDFSVGAVLEAMNQLAQQPGFTTELLFLDCATDVLLRRFSETRRRHPLAKGDRPEAGIVSELGILGPIRELADILINTSDLNVHQLRSEVENWFSNEDDHGLSVSVQSFSYKRGLPRSVDMVFDCRFLNNPYWEPSLREINGKDKAVADYIAQDRRFEPFRQKVEDLALWLLPAYLDEGKSHLSIAFGCTGGQHRSVAMAESLAQFLTSEGWQVSLRHRELDRGKRRDEAAE
jgi:UPF0042 nucleotide-binding protein